MAMNLEFSSTIIEAKQLFENLDDEDLKVIDSRWYIDDKTRGLREYKEKHIPNSVFLDIDFFSDKKSCLPHMIDSPEEFKKKVSKLGIKNSDKLVIYDQEGFFSSSRVWFLFKIFGHKKISILNGGFNNWIKYFATENSIKYYDESVYKVSYKKNFIFCKEEVKNILNNHDYQIIDARPENRFKGFIPEPRKNVTQGRIKESINIPFNQICCDGKILNDNKLKALLYKNKNIKKKKIVVLCGSGVTACNIIFALQKINHKHSVSLYDGSWSEWGMM